MGRFGEIAAKIIDHYKNQLSSMIKKISATGLSGLVKIITDIRDDIIKIIQGGHVTTYEIQEVSNNFDESKYTFINTAVFSI